MTKFNTVDPAFKIKVALDTQLLAYLIDDSYPSFTRFYECLKKFTLCGYSLFSFCYVRIYRN